MPLSTEPVEGTSPFSVPARTDWPHIARLWALSFGALVVWSRVGVLLHEAAGHSLVALSCGVRVTETHVSLFGGGHVKIDTDLAEALWGDRFAAWFLFHMSGVFVNLALGLGLGVAIVWLLAADRRDEKSQRACLPCRPPSLKLRRTRPVEALAKAGRTRHDSSSRLVGQHLLAWGALLNLAGATHYTVLGAFYEFGDPQAYPWLWSPALALLIVATPVTFHLWARTLRPLVMQAATRRTMMEPQTDADENRSRAHLPSPAAAPVRGKPARQPQGLRTRATSVEPRTESSRVPGRLGLTGLVVAAVPLAAYAAGLAIESHVKGTSFRALQAEGVAVARAMEQERAKRLEKWCAEHGDEEPPPEVTEVTEEDIERPFPLTAVVLGLDAVFLGTVLFGQRLAAESPLGKRSRRVGPGEAPPRGAPSVSWAWPLAAAALALVLCHVLS